MPGRPSSEEIYSKFAPLGAWLNQADPEVAQPILAEDATKRNRLITLHEKIGLPVPDYIFVSPAALNEPDGIRNLFGNVDNTQDRFAVAYLPKPGEGQVVRHRGLSLGGCIEWAIDKRPPNAEQYDLLIEPSYENNEWSTIFVVDDDGVFGEIIEGQHFQLTLGSHVEGNNALQFLLKGNTLYTKGDPHAEAREAIRNFINNITVLSKTKQAELRHELGAEFSNAGYLKGYFEAVIDDRFGEAFIDYNAPLGRLFTIPETLTRTHEHSTMGHLVLPGQVVVEGVAEGTLKSPEDLMLTDEFEGAILTAELTRAEDVPLMKLADGIVTEKGGLTSHAAIVARMLGKPCMVAVANAMGYLGHDAILDAYKGHIIVS